MTPDLGLLALLLSPGLLLSVLLLATFAAGGKPFPRLALISWPLAGLGRHAACARPCG